MSVRYLHCSLVANHLMVSGSVHKGDNETTSAIPTAASDDVSHPVMLSRLSAIAKVLSTIKYTGVPKYMEMGLLDSQPANTYPTVTELMAPPMISKSITSPWSVSPCHTPSASTGSLGTPNIGVLVGVTVDVATGVVVATAVIIEAGARSDAHAMQVMDRKATAQTTPAGIASHSSLLTSPSPGSP